jgi:hypothetical protein
MKKTSFRQKTYEEVIASKKKARVKKPPKKKVVKPKPKPLKSLRNRNDKLLTPLAKKICEKCMGCGSDAQVGHHWIEKSRSSNLRYNMENIIALCNSCHAKIHNRFGANIMGSFDITERIISIKGIDWKERMEVMGRKIIKVNRQYYEHWHKVLIDLMKEYD